ncbi:hypothetical protein ACFUJR_35285, partial [Streptomyces sp. NPDC057271]
MTEITLMADPEAAGPSVEECGERRVDVREAATLLVGALTGAALMLLLLSSGLEPLAVGVSEVVVPAESSFE